MIIFQRQLTLQGPPQEVIPWALDMTALVNDKTDIEVSLWQSMFGRPVGTVGWSALIPGLTTLEAVNESLIADGDYLELVTRARDWVDTPAEDHLVRMNHIAGGEFERPSVGSYVEATQATPQGGSAAAAAAFGVEISDLYADLTGAKVMFCSSAYGPFGEMVWFGLHPTAASVDDAAEQIAKSPEYVAKVDAAGGLFEDGTGARSLARRIA